MSLPDSRAYTRELSDKEIDYLKRKHEKHIKKSREGFLNVKQKERLLHITKWREESGREVYDFFYEIRERAHSAIMDFKLLSDTLNEEQLEQIFTKKETIITENNEKLETGDYPVTELMKSLIPYPILIGSKAKEEMMKIQEKQQWRKYILEDLVIESLLWYFHSGLFKTDAQHRLLFDVIDAIQVHSSGKKQYHLYTETGGDFGIVKF